MITMTFDRLPRNETETDSEYYYRIIDTFGLDMEDEELQDEGYRILDHLWLHTDSEEERDKMCTRPDKEPMDDEQK